MTGAHVMLGLGYSCAAHSLYTDHTHVTCTGWWRFLIWYTTCYLKRDIDANIDNIDIKMYRASSKPSKNVCNLCMLPYGRCITALCTYCAEG